jgi:hypothetical protein
VRLLRRLFAVGAAATVLLSPLGAAGSEVWLAPFNPLLVPIVQPGAESDYFALFSPSAPWPRASAAVQVFKIGSGLVLNGTDGQLQTIFQDLKRRHIALGLEIMALTARPECGQKVEGYGRAGDMARMMERIHRLGGDLQYVAMDGPMWAGHLSNLPNACHDPMSAVVADVANTVSIIRQTFPAAQIGDIETLGRNDPANLPDENMRWVKAYQDATGQPLAFVHFDVVWGDTMQRQFQQIVPRLHAAGIKVGLIYNGDRQDQTDLAWTTKAEQRFSIVEANPDFVPDHAVIQTWMIHPSRVLPETQPGTLTWLVNRYLTAETRLELHRVGERLEGRITDSTGQPVPGATLALSSAINGSTSASALHTRTGTVPPRAATAVLALRINSECECSGVADVAIGTMAYREQGSSQAVQQTFHPQAGPAGATGRFHAQPGQAVTQNTPRFPVTPNAPFTVEVPMSISPVTVGSGYVALIFLDAQGKGLLRLRIPFEPVARDIGTVQSDQAGRFSMQPSAETLRASVGFHAAYNGDAQHRTTEAGLR